MYIVISNWGSSKPRWCFSNSFILSLYCFFLCSNYVSLAVSSCYQSIVLSLKWLISDWSFLLLTWFVRTQVSIFYHIHDLGVTIWGKSTSNLIIQLYFYYLGRQDMRNMRDMRKYMSWTFGIENKAKEKELLNFVMLIPYFLPGYYF